jgi:hypothetical protein
MLIVAGMGRAPLVWLGFDFLVGPAAELKEGQNHLSPLAETTQRTGGALFGAREWSPNIIFTA